MPASAVARIQLFLDQIGLSQDKETRRRELNSRLFPTYLHDRWDDDTFETFLNRRISNTNGHRRRFLPNNIGRSTQKRHAEYASEYHRIYGKGVSKAAQYKGVRAPRRKPLY